MSTEGEFTIFQVPSDQAELQLQYDRVIRVLDLVIEKVKICVCLPDFLAQSSKLLDVDVGYIQEICAKYCYRQPSISTGKCTASSVRRKTKPSALDSLRRFVNPQMTQVVEILYKNYQLKKASLENDLLISGESARFVSSLKLMRDIMDERCKVNAVEQIMREKFLKSAYKENIEMKGHLLALTSEGEKQRREFNLQINSKNATLLGLQKEISRRNTALKEETKLIAEKNEAGLAEDRETSKLRQQELATESKTVANQYDNLLSQHLKSERKLRVKRLKTETQLSGWLSKYDFDMQDRQAEFDVQMSGFEEEQDAFDALVVKMNELEEMSASFMEEKEEEDEQQRLAVNFFSRNRAARVIQRYYRAYRFRLLKSKKKDKQKKKKK
ncbi:hypothetical protein PPYR_13817 [Photinus pyralis]|uniref:Dynein regulatory complex protein 10 n=2 Tax=Photinus pyralis TaxID=7054 RepID=A0A5N4AA60_PHOPY|nr:dynein regulatory complex protein 10-like [Photinus pyralis]KAB0794197.1 hypothetical protein PPYR_13817 [Photinus pyralis]